MSASPQMSKVPGAQPTTERRRNRRRAIVDEQIVPVTLDGDNGGLVLDLGENGLAVQAVAALQAGKTTEMTFVLPDTRVSISALGDVRWSEPSGRAGIRLLAFSKGSSADLRAALLQPPAPAAAPAEKQTPVAPAVTVDSLESEVSSRGLDREAALGHIAERTRELASASGIAIALGSSQQMMCRASAGAAPPVGVRLQSDSGLSGECVRSGLLVRCDDTETDSRVDAAVCRQLDLRSAVLVPIVEGGELRGVLEVFSNRPHAFASDDIRRFEQVSAVIAKLVREPAVPSAAVAPPLPVSAASRRAQAPVVESAPPAIAADAAPMFSEVSPASFSFPKLTLLPRRYVVAGCAAVVLAFAVAGWAVAHYRRGASPAPVVAAAPVVVPAAAQTTAQPLTPQVVEVAPAQPEPAKPAKELKPAAKSEPAAVASEGLAIREIPSAVPSTDTEPVAPPMMVAATGPLPDLAVSRALPAAPQSSGPAVVPGRLVRRVNPAYPEVARRTHIAGTVVLKAIVRADGNVEKVDVVSGSRLLAGSAVTAVRQWKYEPFRLNGKPVQAEVNIRLEFNPDLHPKR